MIDPVDQRELANLLAPIVSPASYGMVIMAGTSEYIRALYGDEAADGYVRDQDYELFLEREGRRGEYILEMAGCKPPYEVSVPKEFPWLTVEKIDEIIADYTGA